MPPHSFHRPSLRLRLPPGTGRKSRRRRCPEAGASGHPLWPANPLLQQRSGRSRRSSGSLTLRPVLQWHLQRQLLRAPEAPARTHHRCDPFWRPSTVRRSLPAPRSHVRTCKQALACTGPARSIDMASSTSDRPARWACPECRVRRCRPHPSGIYRPSGRICTALWAAPGGRQRKAALSALPAALLPLPRPRRALPLSVTCSS
mmetsp:Transcript_79629/g.131712  ORF Transcript_79629/g.131712 Transcript_79629/m.131712 type:complete len:203 (+) Transcript_79629:470-1078(+)